MKATIHGQFEKDEFIGKQTDIFFNSDKYFVGTSHEWIGEFLIQKPKCYLLEMAMEEMVNKNETKARELKKIADSMNAKEFWERTTELKDKIFSFSITYNIPETILNGRTAQDWVQEYIIFNSIKYQYLMDEYHKDAGYQEPPLVTETVARIRKNNIKKLNALTIT